jgi:hypothetical protein
MASGREISVASCLEGIPMRQLVILKRSYEILSVSLKSRIPEICLST